MSEFQADIQNGGVDVDPGVQDGGDLPKAASLHYGVVCPRLVVQAPRATEAMHFYKRAFGAKEVFKPLHAKRKAEQEQPLLLHAQLKFGKAEFMICDESEFFGPTLKSPTTLNGTTAMLHVETNDVDAAVAQAVEAGAKVVKEVADEPWGQRYVQILDPFGFLWNIATPISTGTESTAEELNREEAE
eukprot:c47097_g1_i1 orf=260-820(-)